MSYILPDLALVLMLLLQLASRTAKLYELSDRRRMTKGHALQHHLSMLERAMICAGPAGRSGRGGRAMVTL